MDSVACVVLSLYGKRKKRSWRVGALLFLASLVINYSALQPYSKTNEKATVNDTKYDTEEIEGEVWLCVCADVSFQKWEVRDVKL